MFCEFEISFADKEEIENVHVFDQLADVKQKQTHLRLGIGDNLFASAQRGEVHPSTIQLTFSLFSRLFHWFEIFWHACVVVECIIPLPWAMEAQDQQAWEQEITMIYHTKHLHYSPVSFPETFLQPASKRC